MAESFVVGVDASPFLRGRVLDPAGVLNGLPTQTQASVAKFSPDAKYLCVIPKDAGASGAHRMYSYDGSAFTLIAMDAAVTQGFSGHSISWLVVGSTYYVAIAGPFGTGTPLARLWRSTGGSFSLVASFTHRSTTLSNFGTAVTLGRRTDGTLLLAVAGGINRAPVVEWFTITIPGLVVTRQTALVGLTSTATVRSLEFSRQEPPKLAGSKDEAPWLLGWQGFGGTPTALSVSAPTPSGTLDAVRWLHDSTAVLIRGQNRLAKYGLSGSTLSFSNNADIIPANGGDLEIGSNDKVGLTNFGSPEVALYTLGLLRTDTFAYASRILYSFSWAVLVSGRTPDLRQLQRDDRERVRPAPSSRNGVRRRRNVYG